MLEGSGGSKAEAGDPGASTPPPKELKIEREQRALLEGELEPGRGGGVLGRSFSSEKGESLPGFSGSLPHTTGTKAAEQGAEQGKYPTPLSSL